jgi:hypothetical protein
VACAVTQDADGLSTRLGEPLIKRGGAEFKLDAKKVLQTWEIVARDLTKEARLGSGQFGDVFEGTYRGTKVSTSLAFPICALLWCAQGNTRMRVRAIFS